MNELSENAKSIFEKLYSFSGESIDDTFRRVAKEFANNKEEEELAFNLQKNNIWRPNTPVYLNAGTKHKVFSGCFVVDLEDSMDSIYNVANVARRIFQHGAGIGIPIGNLRESEAYIYEGETDHAPEGKSSGPLTFMKLFDAVGETTKSGGRVRRAAILCDMQVSHPDIMNFIRCKEIDGRLSNMNISIAITNNFMECLKDNTPFSLITPYDGSKMGEVDPSNIWNNLVEMNWRTADPGMIFIDTVNKYNVLKKRYTISVLNPCSEQCLPGFFACSLSAINLRKFINEDKCFDFQSFYNTAHSIMRLMDNILDKMDYPDPRFKENSIKYRQVGIGPMGLADTMFELDIKYDSSDGKKFAGEIMRTMTTACLECSAELTNERGKFHDYDVFKDDVESIMFEFIKGHDRESIVKDKILKYGIRNCSVTTCQPTGTTAISCDASYGIEPCFGLVFQKNLIDGSIMTIVNPVFERRFKNESWYTNNLIDKIFDNGGSLKGIRGIPKDVREVFVTAHDIKPKDRIDTQAELQRYNTSAISSTINLSKDATLDDISNIYRYAYEKGLKGVTVYRDGSKKNQPVTFTKENKVIEFERPSKLTADVFTVDTGNGKMYVTVSSMNSKPIELFLHIGKSGQVLNTFSEALGRVISIALQNGVPVDSITKTLIGINSDKPVWYRFEETDVKPVQILSVADGIAQLLNRYYSGKNIEVGGETCPSCHMDTLLMIEGCKTCSNCTYSACS